MALAFIAANAMARHYLYEATNVLLTTVRRPSALLSCGLKLMKRREPKRARSRWRARLASAKTHAHSRRAMEMVFQG